MGRQVKLLSQSFTGSIFDYRPLVGILKEAAYAALTDYLK